MMLKKMVLVMSLAMASFIANASEQSDIDILFSAAKEQNNADAQWMLAEFYFSGIGLEQSFQKAIYWYEQAAEQGNAGALEMLGNIYAKGLGTQPNANTATSYYKKSCELGNKNACSSYEKLN